MNKAELVALVARKSNQTQAVSGAVIDATLEAMSEALKDGETVTLVGFGIYTPKRTAQRMGRNPQNGDPAVIPARNTVSFKVSKGLKDLLNS